MKENYYLLPVYHMNLTLYLFLHLRPKGHSRHRSFRMSWPLENWTKL